MRLTAACRCVEVTGPADESGFGPGSASGAALVLERDLDPCPVGLHLPLLKLQVQLNHLGNTKLPQREGGPGHCGARRLLPRLVAGTNQLNDLVHALSHDRLPSGADAAGRAHSYHRIAKRRPPTGWGAAGPGIHRANEVADLPGMEEPEALPSLCCLGGRIRVGKERWATEPAAAGHHCAAVSNADLFRRVPPSASIAAVYGHDPHEEEVRSALLLCLLGNGATEALKRVGVDSARS